MERRSKLLIALLSSITLASTATFSSAEEVQALDPNYLFTVCHKGYKTMVLPLTAVKAHLAHGDAQGACSQ